MAKHFNTDDILAENEVLLMATLSRTRSLYSLLINTLCKDPVESLTIIALWTWLHKRGLHDIIYDVISLPHPLINQIFNEASTCIKFINGTSHFCNLTLTQKLIAKELSPQFFLINRVKALFGIGEALREVCLTSLIDLFESSMMEKPRIIPLPHVKNTVYKSCQVKDVPEELRTMFLTFSKGYPIAEGELRYVLSRIFGPDCIEALHMQRVWHNEQALYARMVFRNSSTIDMILKGQPKAKFAINGKHIWMRRFVPRKSY